MRGSSILILALIAGPLFAADPFGPRNVQVRGLRKWYDTKKDERVRLIKELRAEAEIEKDEEAKAKINYRIRTLLRTQLMPPALDLRNLRKGDVGMVISKQKDTEAPGEVFFKMISHETVDYRGKKCRLCEVQVYVDKARTGDSSWFLWDGDGSFPPFMNLQPPYNFSGVYYENFSGTVLALVTANASVTDGAGFKRKVPVLVQYRLPQTVKVYLPKTVAN